VSAHAGARVRIGTSGWSYAHWRGVLYERGTRDLLARYAREFDTVELNASFYRWPSVERFTEWRRRLPEGFTLAVKAPRGLTHARRLHATPEWMQRIGAGLDALGERSGPLLVQLPPALERDDELLATFLAALPVRARPAVEFRHPSWHDDEVAAVLEHYGAAACIVSGPGMETIESVTAPFVYVRMHGPEDAPMYAGAYGPAALDRWAERVRGWARDGREVFVYFNNDLGGHAVRDARWLRDALR
jgi:uncharacterized protein YecE (DUF72 family)